MSPFVQALCGHPVADAFACIASNIGVAEKPSHLMADYAEHNLTVTECRKRESAVSWARRVIPRRSRGELPSRDFRAI